MLSDGVEKIKGFSQKGFVSYLLDLLIILLASLASFYLGRASVSTTNDQPNGIIVLEPTSVEAQQLRERYSQTSVQKEAATPIETGKSASSAAFGASVNGTKYYPLGCGGLKRIKEENILWFTTEQEAIDAGYSRAANC